MTKHIHMIGIGGIGISSLAQLYVHQGFRVSGTNNDPSPQTLDRLRAMGVPISLDISITALPHDVDMFVYSDAWLSLEPVFMNAVRALGKPTFSYFEALGEATREGVSIVVSGTHGKTTTTAMIAKVLVDLGKDPTVICGSIMSEFGSNFRAGRPDLFVIEGCEYRRHFLHLHPYILLINNIELDHTDYYHDLADMEDAFRSAVALVPEGGTVVADTDVKSVREVLASPLTPTLSRGERGHPPLSKERAGVGMLSEKSTQERCDRVTVVPYQSVQVPTLLVPGDFNKANACATKAVVYALDPDLHEADIDASLASFRGTWRRFEYKGLTKGGAMVYDDYAHHPTAVRGTLEMVRREFPDKKLVVVFHPHLYSRTHDFMDEFASALALADEILLAPIYAAREAPLEGVTSEVLADKVTALGTPARAFDSLDAVVAHLTSESCKLTSDTLLLTMGAGDVYRVAESLIVHP